MPNLFEYDFTKIKTLDDLSIFLNCRQDTINKIIKSNYRPYKVLNIPKRNRSRGTRTVLKIECSEFSDSLKSFSRRFELFLKSKMNDFPSTNINGYISGRSILRNARPHIGANYLLKLDIKDFFKSIKRELISSRLINLDINPQIATDLSRFLTVDNELPLGFPSSPVIANFIFHNIDIKIESRCKELNCEYSRYADDLVFSNKIDNLPSRKFLEKIFSQNGFEICNEKFVKKKRGQSFYVTGLSITDQYNPRVSREFKRNLRQELYYIQKLGIEKHIGRKGYNSYQSGVNKIDGKIRFLKYIEPLIGKKLYEQWLEILNQNSISPSYKSQSNDLRKLSLFFDESEISLEKRNPILSIACVVTETPDIVRANLNGHLERLIANPYDNSRKKSLIKKGLHWTDLNETTRDNLLEIIYQFPLRAYIAFKTTSQESYKEDYSQLVAEILKHRFIALDNCNLCINFEQNPRVPEKDILQNIRTVYQSLKTQSSRRPVEEIELNVQDKKSELYLSIPDAFLGVFGKYIKSGGNEKASSLVSTRFEILRDKIRVINDCDNQKIYTRRKCFYGV